MCMYQRHGCQIFPVRAVPLEEKLAGITQYMKCGPLSDNTVLTPNDDFSNWRTRIRSTNTVIRSLL